MDLTGHPPKSTLPDFRSKSSMPIEIPYRRQPIVSWNCSSPRSPTSPDLIFEMSPVLSEFPSCSTIQGAGFPDSAPDSNTPEPFMYSFPKLAAHRNQLSSGRRAQPLQKSIFSVSGSLFAPAIPPAIAKHCSLSYPGIDDDGIAAPPSTCTSIPVTKSASTTKISGFTPVTPLSTPGYSPIRPLKTKRLSPPPRSSSYSSSPWILPGKSDTQHEESGSLETDPSSFEFERHLMRRIENQNSRRFRRLSLISSP